MQKIFYRRAFLSFAVLATLQFSCAFCLALRAQKIEPASGEEDAEKGARLAAIKAYAVNDQITVQRRADLEDLLHTVAEHKQIRRVFFYEVHSEQRALHYAASWVVAVSPSTPHDYDVYSFEGHRNSDEALHEFNRFAFDLELSVPESQATQFAGFFLTSCDAVQPGQFVKDENDVRVVVENFYYAKFSGVWRTLDAYVWWWRGFQASAVSVAPKTQHDEKGRYNVLVNKVVTSDEKHPEVREWKLDISPEGQVRVLAVQLIYPPEPRWLFFDSF